ncbi:MAG: hypothetical protein M1347_03550, partial [Chloroflexi bacterium]|nr:hypothetical protein [Chloroflexota bacterium]
SIIDLPQTFSNLDGATKNELADLEEQPLALGLHALDLMEEKSGESYHSVTSISIALEHAGVSIDPATLTKAFARAGARVKKRDTGGILMEYRIMTSGKRYLETMLQRGAIRIVYIEDGKPLTGRVELNQILTNLEGELRIFDPYYGLRTLESLAKIPVGCSVRFLTTKTSEKATKLDSPIRDFKKECSHVVIRTYSEEELHDRYIITPDSIYLLGQGIKDIGDKESFIIQFSKRNFRIWRKRYRQNSMIDGQHQIRYKQEIALNPGTRACIAFVAAGLINKKSGSSIYDFSQSKHVPISGPVSRQSVNIYDHDRQCHFGGSPTSLYDYGESCHVSLDINGQSFSGYNFGSSIHFSGSVAGNSVTLYDFGESKYFQYTV